VLGDERGANYERALEGVYEKLQGVRCQINNEWD